MDTEKEKENKKAGQLAGFLVAAYQITSWQHQQQERLVQQQEQQRQQQERLVQQELQQQELVQQELQQQELVQQELQQLLLFCRKRTGIEPTGQRAGRSVSFIFPF